MIKKNKKVLGQIEVIQRHRTERGFIFRPGFKTEYFNIVQIKDECNCGKPPTIYESYETQYGLIPKTKAKII